MKCKCIEKLDAQVKSVDPEGYVETKLVVSLKSSVYDTAFPPIYYNARKKNKDGELTGKPKRGFFFFNFCPMCGKPVK